MGDNPRSFEGGDGSLSKNLRATVIVSTQEFGPLWITSNACNE